MVANFSDLKMFAMGNDQQLQWNKKLCFQARDALFDCVDAQPNGNKLRCPDELYGYEMWCPTEFRAVHSQQYAKAKLDDRMYNAEMVNRLNR